MFSRKGNLSIAMAVMLVVVLILAIGGAWAAPLLAGPVYLPYVPKQPTYTPTATPTPTRTPTPTPTRTATPVITNPILNPGFEAGAVSWVFYSNQGDPILVSPFAHTGIYSAELGNGNNNRIAYISQQFTVPSNAYNLQYWKYIQSGEHCLATFFDVVKVYIDGNLLETTNICDDFNSLNFTKSVINLVNYRGDTIVFRMEFTSDNNTPSIFRVDDFSFIP